MNYYYSVNGQQFGPVAPNQLVASGVNASTLVWCEGMTQWQPAGQVAELAPYFQQVAPPMPPGGGYGAGEQRPPMPSTNLVWAILTTIFCCLPFGIVAIVQASGVSGAYAAGNYEEAKRKSKSAATWSLVAAIVGLILIIVYVIYWYMVLRTINDYYYYNY